MTDEVGVITGDLTVRTEYADGRVTVRVQYKDADEWYAVTGGAAPLADPADVDAVHGSWWATHRYVGRAAATGRRGRLPSTGCVRPTTARRRPPGSGRRSGGPAGSPARATSGGSSVAQMSCAFQHRVRNRQPDGGLIGLGTSPVSSTRSRWRCSRRCGSGHRHRGHQRHRVRVPRLRVQLVPVGDLDDLAEVHDRDPVGDVPHHRQVVRDDHVGQPELRPAGPRAG